MKSNQTPKTGPSVEVLIVRGSDTLSDLEHFAAAYVRFDALMTAQLQELEHRFRQYLTPRAKLEKLGRR
jgi:hypothetical protein